MSTQVEPEEVEALLAECRDEVHARGAIAQRDFRRPNRWSAEHLTTVSRALRAALPAVERRLSSLLSSPCKLGLDAVREMSAEGLFDGIEAPLAVVRFESEGQPGWVVWDSIEAGTCIDRILGSGADPGADLEGDEPEPRHLSRIERRMLAQLVGVMTIPMAGALGVTPEELRGVAVPAELGTWRDGKNGGDAHRLVLDLAIEGPGGAGSIRIYVPGAKLETRPEREAGEAPEKPELPDHLEEVKVTLSARLGSVDVPLADLLSLEIGDVIPLGTSTEEPLRLFVEDRLCATAVAGNHRGHLAVRIHENRSSTSDDS